MLTANRIKKATGVVTPAGVTPVSLLYLDTDATDESGKIWSNTGVTYDASISEDGNGSARFTGDGGPSSTAGDYLRSPAHSDFIIGSQDFTLETFVRLDSYPSTVGVLTDFRPPNTNGKYINWGITPSGELTIYIDLATRLTTTTTMALSTFYHVAMERYSGETRLYIDGIASGGFWADSTVYAGDRLTIGTSQYHLSLSDNRSFGIDGWGDNYRITIGEARYKGNFTPPVAPLTF